MIRFPLKAMAGNHAGAHLVHDRKHLVLIRPRRLP